MNNQLYGERQKRTKVFLDGLAKRILNVAAKNTRISSIALFEIAFRIWGSWRARDYLVRSCPTKTDMDLIANDFAAILRCQYDAFLQAAYLVNNPNECEARGRLFSDYGFVEANRVARILTKQNTPWAKWMRNTPGFAEVEKERKARYDRVKQQFVDKKGKACSHWYPGDLASIARKLGLLDEYECLIAMNNSSVHTGPGSLGIGPPFMGAVGLDVAHSILAKTLKLVMTHNGINAPKITEGLDQFVALFPNAPIPAGVSAKWENGEFVVEGGPP